MSESYYTHQETRVPHARSLGQLVGDIGRDISRLVRDEVRLASAETGEKLNQVIKAAVTLAIGLVLALAALLVLLYAVVVWLSNYMEPWLAAVVTGGVVGVIALILISAGQNRLKAANLMPERTMNSLRRTSETVKDHAHTPTREDHR